MVIVRKPVGLCVFLLTNFLSGRVIEFFSKKLWTISVVFCATRRLCGFWIGFIRSFVVIFSALLTFFWHLYFFEICSAGAKIRFIWRSFFFLLLDKLDICLITVLLMILPTIWSLPMPFWWRSFCFLGDALVIRSSTVSAYNAGSFDREDLALSKLWRFASADLPLEPGFLFSASSLDQASSNFVCSSWSLLFSDASLSLAFKTSSSFSRSAICNFIDSSFCSCLLLRRWANILACSSFVSRALCSLFFAAISALRRSFASVWARVIFTGLSLLPVFFSACNFSTFFFALYSLIFCAFRTLSSFNFMWFSGQFNSSLLSSRRNLAWRASYFAYCWYFFGLSFNRSRQWIFFLPCSFCSSAWLNRSRSWNLVEAFWGDEFWVLWCAIVSLSVLK